ncbi:hydantoinase/oxoprolinase family protein [Rhizobium rhizogenes]|uniref:Hydantoin utilization protein A n=1 Tax=Rhizobium rhizogenes NBRC 13257 TaxID=1220581 RepID=A0AA87QDZ4_RHIRH|nr:hydantoinase/oxoprolinase family protein [Rhizobium rhizogenes]MCJ9720557.1 hydantoinase/oxoprolinase family protein [Agrobacterium sp. BETTINA12B]TRB11906.1 hydantoinase/oxoprolinase family protein [Rhizobium rhizogenes]TRB43299.1 hydantoinase/oxoprolinase family protein [Rhizobium rhizogenes]TRB60458.1 hydantoinase/oxoprolinase family protein [Rhizobium rhizogenes]WEO68105.1 hydantoinase/oxoprolinase family protein [Rhizobium rhizogenes]
MGTVVTQHNSNEPSGPTPEQSQVAGIDVGGTFTDLVLFDTVSGKVRLAKTPTTLDNQAFGVLNALDAAEADVAALDLIVHGTTTTTNAVLERNLCRTGLITTRGFRDVLELGRRTRPNPYGMKGEFRPIIPRDLRLEVPERMDAAGNVLIPLDEEALRIALKALVDTDCESLVIHFLHAYANPAHELRAGEIAAEIWPNDNITLGHALLSESREFERGVTAAVNASVQPLLARYIERLADQLAAKGYRHDVLVMNGNGGMVSARHVAKEAAKTVMSGPASGVMAAAYTGRRAGIPNLITYDMGGTSTDVALIRNAEPAVSNEIEIEYAMPIHVPMVDVRTVGAGGGSIAKVTAAGLLQVGPESAGAMPGPICYGRGGTTPTISDANLLLGRLNPSKLNSVPGGISIDGIRELFEEKLGRPLGLDATAAAAAVIRIANARMADAVRMVSVSLGEDPRDFALFSFGGAGPLHATAIARELGIPRVLTPSRPGITNALGCVVADLRHDFVNTVNRPLDVADMDVVHALFEKQSADGRRLIGKEAVAIREIREIYSVDMQFIGQTHLLRVPLPSAMPTRAELQARFEEAYFNRFHVELPEIRASLVNVNTSVIGRRTEIDLSMLIDAAGRKSTLAEAQTGTRSVWFDGWRETPIYWRDHLPIKATISGPAIIEQMDTTIILEPGDVANQDDDGNIIISIGAGQ